MHKLYKKLKGVNEMSDLKRTPIYSVYEKYGARTIDFGGWDLPVQFSSIKQEHEATRTNATVFDVSHMGQIVVSGEDSEQFLLKMLTNNVQNLKVGRAHYTFMCYEDGGTVDDFLVYRLAEKEFLLVVNAANTEKDYEWLVQHVEDEDVQIKNETEDYAILAVQGPKAEEILQDYTEDELAEIPLFGFNQEITFNNIDKKALVSRTGYTGEDGFEIYIDKEVATKFWNMLLEGGKEKGLEPAGLGARDTLRFEVGLPLYGQELSKDITPIEAGQNFFVKIDRPTKFIGQDVLEKQINEGASRKLVGLEMIDRGIPRTDYEVLVDEKVIGKITSGTQSPTLGKNLGLALIDTEHAEKNNEVYVQIRKRQVKAKVIDIPFLKK